MKLKSYFVISDIHGCLSEFVEILENWDPFTQQLIILGDLIDRGIDSLGVIELIREIQCKYDVIVLKGNHEDLFLKHLSLTGEEHKDRHMRNGGQDTLDSFMLGETYEEQLKFIHTNYSDIVNWLEKLPYYHETKDFIFVHAGINLQIENWKQTSERDFIWDRTTFLEENINNTGKIIIFGHTETNTLPNSTSNDVWYSPCKSKIGIDGGCVYGGQLNYLILEEKND